jgi:hypothetical protein
MRAMSAVALASAIVGLAAGPAGAAQVPDAATQLGNGGLIGVAFAQNPVSINAGDSVVVSFSAPSGHDSGLGFYTSPDCSSGGVGVVHALTPDTLTLMPPSSTTYYVLAIDSTSFGESACTPFTVNVSGAPPPDVSEAPFAAGLLGVVAVAFGVGFFVLRRRGARSAV